MDDTAALTFDDRANEDVENIHSQALHRVLWHIFGGLFGKHYEKKNIMCILYDPENQFLRS